MVARFRVALIFTVASKLLYIPLISFIDLKSASIIHQTNVNSTKSISSPTPEP